MSGKTSQAFVWVTAALFLTALAGEALWAYSRRFPAIPVIACIPQTAGAMLWEVEHFGATVAAEKLKFRLYWNTPTSENDMAGQVSLIDRVARGRYQGLVLAPNQTLGVLAPLRRALAAGLPVVVVSAQLDLPAGNKLGYIVNDDEKMGELAAAEVARLIHGRGSIALVGLARYAPGVASRVRSAECLLASRPDIHVVSRVSGTNDTRSEDLTDGILQEHPDLKAVISFTAASTRGVHAALCSRSLQRTVILVGCEQDSDLLTYVGMGEIAAIVAENTYRMGYEAIGLIADSLAGKPLPARSVIPPLLIAKENLDGAESRLFTSFPR
jgi:ribose transport system substrate-binding protein